VTPSEAELFYEGLGGSRPYQGPGGIYGGQLDRIVADGRTPPPISGRPLSAFGNRRSCSRPALSFRKTKLGHRDRKSDSLVQPQTKPHLLDSGGG